MVAVDGSPAIERAVAAVPALVAVVARDRLVVASGKDRERRSRCCGQFRPLRRRPKVLAMRQARRAYPWDGVARAVLLLELLLA